jgi:hypothetical protein
MKACAKVMGTSTSAAVRAKASPTIPKTRY